MSMAPLNGILQILLHDTMTLATSRHASDTTIQRKYAKEVVNAIRAAASDCWH